MGTASSPDSEGLPSPTHPIGTGTARRPSCRWTDIWGAIRISWDYSPRLARPCPAWQGRTSVPISSPSVPQHSACDRPPQRGHAGKPPTRGKVNGYPISQEGNKWHTRPKPTPSPVSPPRGPWESRGALWWLAPCPRSTAALGESRTSCSPPSRTAVRVSASPEHTVSGAGTRQQLQQPEEAQRSAVPAGGKAALIHQDGRRCQALCQHR